MTPLPRRRLRARIGAGSAVALLTAGCLGGPNAGSGQEDDDRPVVLTTFTIIADIAQNVAGEHLQVRSLIPVGAEVHSYEPTPGDLRQAADADLILDNGLGLEAWFDQFIADVQAPHVVVSEGVEPLEIGAQAGATEAGSSVAGSRPNPHAWMSPRQTQVYVDNMVAAFGELDPDRAQDYLANGRAYAEELEAVHTELVDDLAALPQDQKALVTCEGAFSYLARDAGLSEHYLWPVNAEGEATPRRIAETIAFVRDAQQVPAVFCESTVSDAAMQQVVEATDATFGGVLYVDSLSEPDGPVPTYLDLIRHDVNLIRAGLTGAEG
ncbi:metal ABC transporter solute-binding protein, Zn/Mn family [Sanguibacter sp. Z1732]|uniref:metal ABC transporter solute-binding protein, Zn/Mn family n=1 Tax=Sanguibacter sp. Z1732 TaxID=3435412 RepID=UPI003D9C9966